MNNISTKIEKVMHEFHHLCSEIKCNTGNGSITNTDRLIGFIRTLEFNLYLGIDQPDCETIVVITNKDGFGLSVCCGSGDICKGDVRALADRICRGIDLLSESDCFGFYFVDSDVHNTLIF